MDFDAMFAEYSAYADRIRPFVRDTDGIVQEAVLSKKRVLFEGAQGAFLDLDCGSYPYVTSSHPIAGGACLGTGIGPRDIQNVLGVCKAYTTRVGAGPFPTELHDELGERIRQIGKEFGTTTGRGRRIGWQDVVLLRQSGRLNSLSGLVLTRLDILSGIGDIKVATRYRLDGREIDHVPQTTAEFGRCEPIYETFAGWEGDLTRCRTLGDLPTESRRYLEAIEELTSIPVVILSIGPARDQTIVLRPERIWG